MKHIIISALAILGGLTDANAQSTPADLPPVDVPEPAPQVKISTSTNHVRIEMLVVQTAEAKALALLPELRNPDRIAAAQEKLLALIEKKQAELVDWPVVTTRSGNRCVVENIQELKYPIEFSHPQLDRSVQSLDPVATATPTVPARTVSPLKPGAVIVLGGTPDTFEVKNVGVTLEVEPTIAEDGRAIQMQISSQHVTFRKWNKTTTDVSGGTISYKVAVEQPEFHTVKTTTNFSLASGQPMLQLFSKLKEPAGTVELFILKATIVDEYGREVTTKPDDTAGKAKQEK